LLSYAASLALAETLEMLSGTALSIKWSNDILLDNAKLAGILMEISGAALLLGVGVNVASAPDAPYPTAKIPAIRTDDLHAHFPVMLCRWLERWRRNGFDGIRTAWRARAAYLGQPITVHTPSAHHQGIFADIAENGQLLLRQGERVLPFWAGDVSLREI
jgi:BirA family biotin operon repressor/biotin-[acetyl-CoA-carboxylase] ligase